MHRFLDSFLFDKHLCELRGSIAQQTMRMRYVIKKYFPEGTFVTRPSGGFLLWVELPIQYDAVSVQRQASSESINFLQGALFSDSGKFQNCLRFNCGYPWKDEYEASFIRISKLIQLNIIVNKKK
ncbi:MAG: hypothetical protein ACC656_07480 [Candidatus Heimdallarchaeota archaeon]